jgi:hypothetical protein
VEDTVKHPLKALKVALKGIGTEGPLAPEIPLDRQRPADLVFDSVVARAVEDPHEASSEAAE